MGMIAVIAVIFIALLLLPFVVSLLSLRKSREASLYVKSDNIRDPRYFSNSFRSMVEKGIDRETRTIKMSKLEPFLYAEEVTDSNCDSLVVADRHFQPSRVTCFCKEIYAESSAVIPAKTTLRAIACLDTLDLNEYCEVIRWADSEKQMTVLSGCTLGMSATSAERLLIAPNCIFRRLYAPEIMIGYEAARTVRFPADSTIFDERWTNPERVDSNETVRKTIVTDYSLEIGEGAVIMGSVKSTRHIYVHRNARINGNLVADGAIVLNEGVRILGNVFSQDSILVGPDVEIGVKPKIKSLIARKSITLCETAKVFGYIGCEVDSKTIAQQDFSAELNQKQWASKMESLQAEISEKRGRTGRDAIAAKAATATAVDEILHSRQAAPRREELFPREKFPERKEPKKTSPAVSVAAEDIEDDMDDDDSLFD